MRECCPFAVIFAMIRPSLALLVVGGLLACGGETYPDPGYRPRTTLPVGLPTAVVTAPLSGNVYMADSPTIEVSTSLPEGYQLLSGNEGKVVVRVPGTRPETRAVAIVDGAYTLPDLPVGVDLEVSASHPGFAARRQVIRIALPAGRRLNFGHDPGGTGSYLLPFHDSPG